MKPETIIKPLLTWYGSHKRTLPWRRDGQRPYFVWLSEIMLQQTTVTAVAPYFEKFITHYPTVEDLAAAPSEALMRDWAGLGYYSRARNLHATAKIIAEQGGSFPQDIASLKKLPGIGDYTAGAIAAIAYNQKAVVVDGNVERVITRLFGIETPLPLSKPEIKTCATGIYLHAANTAPSDLPQAFMDLGATICTPTNPKCAACPLTKVCKTKSDVLPKRLKKTARPKRQGFVYWVRDSHDRVLVHTRPDKGLLGGMTGLPTSAWNDAPEHLDGFKIEKTHTSKIKHVFTHFELTLSVVEASIKKQPDGFYYQDVKTAGFPSVFMKVSKLFSD